MNLTNFNSADAYEIGYAYGLLCGIYETYTYHCPATQLREIYEIITKHYSESKLTFEIMEHLLGAFSSTIEIKGYNRTKCLVDINTGKMFVDVLFLEDGLWSVDTVRIDELYDIEEDNQEYLDCCKCEERTFNEYITFINEKTYCFECAINIEQDNTDEEDDA